MSILLGLVTFLVKNQFRRAGLERSVDSPNEVLRIADDSELSGVTESIFKDGANCIFIGHSFFIPIARAFDRLAAQGDFPSHQSEFVFSPGLGGSPGRLWDNERLKERIETKLASGTVELLGMPVVAGSNQPFEDYRKWIDLASKHNPTIRILIGQYWMAGGPKLDVERYAKANAAASQRNFEIIRKLRANYPENHIYFIDYGRIASEMKALVGVCKSLGL